MVNVNQDSTYLVCTDTIAITHCRPKFISHKNESRILPAVLTLLYDSQIVSWLLTGSNAQNQHELAE